MLNLYTFPLLQESELYSSFSNNYGIEFWYLRYNKYPKTNLEVVDTRAHRSYSTRVLSCVNGWQKMHWCSGIIF